MEILFLGTSSGTPTKKRNVSAIAISESKGKAWYLIDCGEGTQHQLLHTNLSFNALRGILITHVHGDHCYGLPGLLASGGLNGRTQPLIIIAPKGIKQWLENTLLQTQTNLPYEIQFKAVEEFDCHITGQFALQAIALSHRVPSFAYIFVDNKVEHKLNIEKLKKFGIPQGSMWGRLKAGENIQHEGETFESKDFVATQESQLKIIVCGDNDTPELLKDVITDCNVLIHEATYAEDMVKEKAKNFGHSCAKHVAEFAEFSGVPNLLLTHFSPRYQDSNDESPSIDDIYLEATIAYSGNLYLAKDFDKYSLDKAGNLILEIRVHE